VSLRRIVTVVQGLAVVASVVFVILLFIDEPTGTKAPKAAATSVAAAGPGQALFATNCASCHGARGQGGLGPQLAGRVKQHFPDAADQVAFVTKGSGSMPAFGNSLTPEQIAAIVAYTRTGL
jgi:mono/diheme cytochrome c family protein